MEQQYWILVTTFTQSTSCVMHQQCMSVVHWIAQLERKHGVCLHHHQPQAVSHQNEKPFRWWPTSANLTPMQFIPDQHHNHTTLLFKESMVLIWCDRDDTTTEMEIV